MPTFRREFTGFRPQECVCGLNLGPNILRPWAQPADSEGAQSAPITRDGAALINQNSRPPCMERNSQLVAAAFHGCRSGGPPVARRPARPLVGRPSAAPPSPPRACLEGALPVPRTIPAAIAPPPVFARSGNAIHMSAATLGPILEQVAITIPPEMYPAETFVSS